MSESKKNSFLPTIFVVLGVFILVMLLIKLNEANKELSLWESKKEVLEEELKNLRIEANRNREFLEKLRQNPDFQNDVARRELGYGKKDEKVFRFSEK
tara:strand:+ start:69 stop:362 length:294 start_codon:yes stop_codon:yes gene_type:complete